MEEKIEIPPGADMKTVVVAWILKQGFQTVFTLAVALYFAWKTNQLEIRLDACQNANVEQMVSSSQAVIRSIETLIGKMEQQNQPPVKIRFKQ